jgi:hypothetical protein
VRAGVAEIDEYSVADKPGETAVVNSNHFRAGSPIGADHLPHIFGIETSRERSRTYQIAEHDGEVASFGIMLKRRFGEQFALIEFGDRAQHFTSMAEQDTEPVEVLVRQFGKDIKIDPVLGKTQRVLSKPKLPEPV